MTIASTVVFITGASRGIGASAALGLARRGARVALFARSGEKLAALAKDVEAAGGEALVLPGDVASYKDIAAAIDKTVERFGRLDVLVNNAGVIDPIARLGDSDPDDWSRVVDINLKGVYFGLRAALPIMQSQGSGVVINISSGAATGALEGWSHYCSTKAGVLSLTRCAHKEYAEHGIRVVGLSPGTVATDMQVVIKASGINPVSQLDPSVHISPEWVARAIEWLATDSRADEFAGTDFSIKTPEGRQLVGLG